MIEASATSRFQSGSARKVGRIAALIRRRGVPAALSALAFLAKPSKRMVMKTLRSAVANAIAKAGKAKLKEEDLVVTEARVDTGPIMKRWMPGPRGMASVIRRRLCHIRVAVATKKGTKL
ncbi:50S ribosomal protein L22 [candidate division WOR-3 bacterium]|nr:50S ribosomal protein L22 [candidate division WOR-3 bacterium]